MSGRMPIIAGNWKMYTTARTAAELCRSLRKRIDDLTGVGKVVCPPFVFLALALDQAGEQAPWQLAIQLVAEEIGIGLWPWASD